MLFEFVYFDGLVTRRYVFVKGVFYVFISAGRFVVDDDVPVEWVGLLRGLDVGDFCSLDGVNVDYNRDAYLRRDSFGLSEDLLISLFEAVVEHVCNERLGLMWGVDGVIEFCKWCYVLVLELESIANLLLSEAYHYLDGDEYRRVMERFDGICSVRLDCLEGEVSSFVRKVYIGGFL